MPEINPDTGYQISLLPSERLISVAEVQDVQPVRLPSSLLELERLTRAGNAREIGDNGPSLSSLSLGDDDEQPSKHLYETVFGRDSLRVAEDLVELYPKLTRATLLKMAELQGLEYSIFREEEPGRIVHEYRDPDVDPVARELTEKRGWGWPYYGTVDATP